MKIMMIVFILTSFNFAFAGMIKVTAESECVRALAKASGFQLNMGINGNEFLLVPKRADVYARTGLKVYTAHGSIKISGSANSCKTDSQTGYDVLAPAVSKISKKAKKECLNTKSDKFAKIRSLLQESPTKLMRSGQEAVEAAN